VRRILVDVNVILDVVLERQPFFAASASLLAAVERGSMKGFVAAHGLTNMFYVVAKAGGAVRAKQAVAEVLGCFGVAAVDARVVQRAMALPFEDLEDAVTCAAAEGAGCDTIATRDARGFAGSPIQAADPAAILARLESEIHEPAAAYDQRPVRRRRRRARGASRGGSR
jgi:predicted nucleic acid-binding protein